MIATGERVVIAVNNTGNESGQCAWNNFTVDEDGDTTIEAEPAQQPGGLLYASYENFEIDLDVSVPLPRETGQRPMPILDRNTRAFALGAHR